MDRALVLSVVASVLLACSGCLDYSSLPGDEPPIDGGADPDGGDPAVDGDGSGWPPPDAVPITLDVLWTGYYQDTAEFMHGLDDEQIGPRVEPEAGGVAVRWLAVIYEDCNQPDDFKVSVSGDQVSLELRDQERFPYCADSDIVADAIAHLALPRGRWHLTVSCSVRGFWNGNGPPGQFDVTVE